MTGKNRTNGNAFAVRLPRCCAAAMFCFAAALLFSFSGAETVFGGTSPLSEGYRISAVTSAHPRECEAPLLHVTSVRQMSLTARGYGKQLRGMSRGDGAMQGTPAPETIRTPVIPRGIFRFTAEISFPYQTRARRTMPVRAGPAVHHP